MQLSDKNLFRIKTIWDEYYNNGQKLIDVKGNAYLSSDFDKSRLRQIEIVKKIILQFIDKKIDFLSFKSSLDGENKRNNYWGFSAIKGQMFFNQLTNSQGTNFKNIADIINSTILEPNNIDSAKTKIVLLENFVQKIYDTGADKRKVPKPSSVAYFLSYFWQIFNFEKWPILYTSLIDSLTELGLWKEFTNQSDAYEYFYEINNNIKALLSTHSKMELTNWDIEHCFWWNQNKAVIIPDEDQIKILDDKRIKQTSSNSFRFYEYIPPIISNLIENGKSKGDTKAVKGVVFEKAVSLAFKILDFDVLELGQGTGRNADLVAHYRPENIAFIIDAKVRSDGYSIGVDDRVFKEYINKHLIELRKNGYKKNGFIVVSSLFLGDPTKFVEDITLETDIKRFTLLTSEALLYLVAYKLKDGISTNEIANVLLQNGIIDGQNIIQSFEDV